MAGVLVPADPRSSILGHLAKPTSADAAEWRDLLPYFDADELRDLLGARGVAACRRRGVVDVMAAGSSWIVATVLATMFGDPSRMIEGETIH